MRFEQLEDRRVLAVSGAAFFGDISPVGDIDDERDGLFFDVTAADLAEAGGQFVATLSLSGATGTFAPEARIFRPSGSQLDTLFSGDKTLLTITQVGRYEVRVQDGGNNATGVYALTLEGIAPPSLDAEEIDRGDVLPGTITTAGDVDEFVFTAGVGDVVTLSLADTALSSFEPRAQLFSPSGQLLDLFSADTNSRFDELSAGRKRVSGTLVEAGTYVVQVYDNDYTDTGSYALAVEGLRPHSLDAVPMLSGNVRNGTISLGEVDEYVFAGLAGSLVTISLSDTVLTTNADLVAELYAPSGQKVEKLQGTNGPDEVDSGERVIYALPETGTYVIQVNDNDLTETEVYGLALEGLDPPSLDAPALAFGQSRIGRLDLMGEVDAYWFPITAADLAGAGGQLAVSLSLVSEETADYRPGATLFAPSGEELEQLNAGQTKILTLAEPGIYVVQVHDNNFTETVAELINRGENPLYALTLQDAQPGQPPSVVTVTAVPLVLSDADAGGGQFAVRVLFNEAMNLAAVPAIVFGSTAVDGGPAPTLSNPTGVWSSTNVPNDTFTVFYDVADQNVEIDNIIIDVLQAQDVDGNLQRDYVPEVEFSIDTLNPQAAVLVPGDNATGISVNTNLRITFSEAIRAGTGNIVVRQASDGAPVALIPAASGLVTVAGSLATIDLNVTLAELTSYYVEIDTEAFVDLAGNRFAGVSGPTAWNFTTTIFTGLTVIALSPVDNDVGVATNTNLVITFSDNIQAGTGSVVIRRSSNGSIFETIPVPSSRVTILGPTATIDPSGTLLADTGYHVEVSAGAFRDLSGNSFAGISGPTAWNFVTAGVLAGPTAQDDLVSTGENTPILIPVLLNDSSTGQAIDPTTLAVVGGAGPFAGTTVVNNGAVTYVPAAGFSGTDSFRYTVRDFAGLESNQATVTIVVVNGAVFQNPAFPEDTNASGFVTPFDVLILINYINSRGTALPSPPIPPATPEFYYDVDGDGLVLPQDVLQAINYLNRVASGGGSGEAEGFGSSASLKASSGIRPAQVVKSSDLLGHANHTKEQSWAAGRVGIQSGDIDLVFESLGAEADEQVEETDAGQFIERGFVRAFDCIVHPSGPLQRFDHSYRFAAPDAGNSG